VVEDADPFELTEEEETEMEVTESTMYWETTASGDEEQTPVEKQLTFLVFESALVMLFATCVCCGSAFDSIKRHMVGSFLSIKQECSQCNNKYTWECQPYTVHTEHSHWESSDVCCHFVQWLLTSRGT